MKIVLKVLTVFLSRLLCFGSINYYTLPSKYREGTYGMLTQTVKIGDQGLYSIAQQSLVKKRSGLGLAAGSPRTHAQNNKTAG